MADLKRKNEAVTQDGAPYNKRARPTSDDETRFRADEVKKQSFYEGGATTGRTDSGSGQKQVFPGLDEDDDGDEPFYGPANDGIEYLRMVRLVMPMIFALSFLKSFNLFHQNVL